MSPLPQLHPRAIDPGTGNAGKALMVDAAGTAVGYGTVPDAETIRDTVAAFVKAGSNVTVTHDDAADTLTIGATGGSGGGGSGGSGGGQVLLREVVLTADTASVSFSGADIPSAGFRDLALRVLGRSSGAGSDDAVLLAFNGDTTAANYSSQLSYTINTTSYGDTTVPRAIGYLDGGAVGTEVAADPGVIDAQIHGYLDTAWRTLVLSAGYVANDPLIGRFGLRWKNTAAVTSITLTLASGANFKAGSRVALYGVPTSAGVSGAGSILATAEATVAATYTTTVTTDADVDATNLAVTFAFPASGKVQVELAAVGDCTAAARDWTLRNGAATVAACTMGSVYARLTAHFRLTGTPGSTATYKWGHRLNGGGTANIYTGGAAGTFGNAMMTVTAL